MGVSVLLNLFDLSFSILINLFQISILIQILLRPEIVKNLAAGHIITGNLKIIPDSRIRNIVSKGPKYRFPSDIDFNKCRKEIAAALNEFGNRWCKREYVEHAALKEWKLSILRIVQRISFKMIQNKPKTP